MARDIYLNTVTQAAADGTLKALAGVQVFVYQPGTTTLATIYAARTGASTLGNPITTDATGGVLFYAEFGEYDVKFHDTVNPARIADNTFAWNAVNASDRGIPTAKLTRDAGLDLPTLAIDVMRQTVPLGGIIDWWRPPQGTGATQDAIPNGFVECRGQTLTAAEHDFLYRGSITVPDLRNKIGMGADSGKADGTASSSGDGTAASTASHPNAPGIGGTAGSNATKNLVHTHQFGHTHGVPGQTTTGAGADRSLGHTHSSGFYGYDHGHHMSFSSSAGTVDPGQGANVPGGTAVTVSRHTHGHSVVGDTWGSGNIGVGGATGGEATPDHLHLNTVSATTTSSQSTTTTDNGTAPSALDVRPAHVGLAKIMKVRRF